MCVIYGDASLKFCEFVLTRNFTLTWFTECLRLLPCSCSRSSPSGNAMERRSICGYMWLEVSPRVIQHLRGLLAWIIEQYGVQSLLHYLDDFLLSSPLTPMYTYQQNLNIVKKIVISWESYWHSVSKTWRETNDILYHSWVLLWILKPWK